MEKKLTVPLIKESNSTDEEYVATFLNINYSTQRIEVSKPTLIDTNKKNCDQASLKSRKRSTRPNMSIKLYWGTVYDDNTNCTYYFSPWSRFCVLLYTMNGWYPVLWVPFCRVIPSAFRENRVVLYRFTEAINKVSGFSDRKYILCKRIWKFSEGKWASNDFLQLLEKTKTEE